MKTTVTTVALVASLAMAAVAMAQDSSKLPGYVNLDEIQLPAGVEVMQEIDLGPDLLAAAFQSKDAADPEMKAVAEALAMVKSVRLITVETTAAQVAQVRDQVDVLQKKLEAKSWKRVVMMRDKEEYVVISALQGAEHIQGLMVMAVEADEATFVNVVGELNFATLASLVSQLESEEMSAALESLQAGQTAEQK